MCTWLLCGRRLSCLAGDVCVGTEQNVSLSRGLAPDPSPAGPETQDSPRPLPRAVSPAGDIGTHVFASPAASVTVPRDKAVGVPLNPEAAP